MTTPAHLAVWKIDDSAHRIAKRRRSARADLHRLSPDEVTAHDVVTAGLHYVRDIDRGFSRKRRGAKFVYFDRNGSRVSNAEEVRRINALAIPPAYVDVWICPDPDGHIQATARDAKGRKQYRYHPRWQEIRAATKFDRMKAFGEALPRIRRRVATLLRQPGLPRDKVLAALVQLLDLTMIRVGNDEYARLNRSYGLTTLLTRHVAVDGTTMQFEFNGKSGVVHRITLRHAGLAAFVRSCLAIPGRELFQYLDENGRRRRLTASDVNGFLQDITGANFTAKDFRTWGASVLALGELRKRVAANAAEARRHSVETIKAVAEKLGNTPAVCRKSYIHPGLIERYKGCALDAIDNGKPPSKAQTRGLRRDESAFLAWLTEWQESGGNSLPVARVVSLSERNRLGVNRDWPGRAQPGRQRITRIAA